MIAFVRNVSSSLDRCELTHLSRYAIDVEFARRQHHEFEQVLATLGCEIRHLAELPDQPDAVFVQDTAIVLDEVAIIARPGAESRRSEIDSVATLSPNFGPSDSSNRLERWTVVM